MAQRHAPIEGPVSTEPSVATAIQAIHHGLSATSPNRIWRNHELRDLDGRRHAVDLLVLCRNGLWVVHAHAEHGRLSGDDEIWIWDKNRIVESPFREIEDRARRLREALQLAGKASIHVRPLVMLTGNVSVDPHSSIAGRSNLVSPPGRSLVGLEPIDRCLRAPPQPGHSVRTADLDGIEQALRSVGLSAVDHQHVAGDYRLGALLADHPNWQEHEGVGLADPTAKVRVRSWSFSPEARRTDLLQRAAHREAAVLSQLGRHPNILALEATVDHDGLPRLLFERFANGLPLHQFLRGHPKLSFEDRLEVLRQVAEALDHCHRHEVVHRNLSPESVLVRRHDDAIEVRLHRFEGAVADHSNPTTFGARNLTHFATRIYDLYRAPELALNPGGADEQSDLFSLGALAWYLFTAKHPGPRLGERNRQLRDEDGLRIWRERDDLDAALDECIAAATRYDVQDRERAVAEWANGLGLPDDRPSIRTWINGLATLYASVDIDALHTVDPLRAQPGDNIGEGYLVESVLGSGASARVLAVRAENMLNALKVPHDAAAQHLLVAEAGVMSRIDHPGVVRLVETVVIGGRTCLLLQHAGQETLADLVRKQGTLALGYVQRLGDELFEVLTHLHERGITHRDLKPSNLAFTTASNQARRLLLFDFSLSAFPAHQVNAGTPRWRDPTLLDRGEWDPAADLYAAAAILYYALTGQRPEWVVRDKAVRVVSTRFDPDLRGLLAHFFKRAFAAALSDRFLDAADMRHAWTDIFARDRSSLPTTPAPTATDPRLGRARPDTPIGALGLSARALNALERAGVAVVRDLMALPGNRLTMVRGVGRETRAEVAAAKAQLTALLGARDDTEITPFLPGKTTPALTLEAVDLGLPEPAVLALHDAGLRTLRDLAEANADRIARLLEPHGVDLTRLRATLAGHAAAIKGVLGDWVNTLLRPNSRSKRTQWETRVGALFGLDPLPVKDPAPAGGRTNAQVAAALGLDPVVFRSSFKSARNRWEHKHDARTRTIAALGAALDRLGHIATIPNVADALLEVHAPHDRHAQDAQDQAIALVRFGTEVSTEPPFVWRRIGDHAWFARNAATLDALQELANEADRLATGDTTTAGGEAQAALKAVARPPLDQLPGELLVQRAVKASGRARLSSRLEIYPRDLSPRRAIELSASLIAPNSDPAAVAKRVHARFPELGPLPERPALDTLLARVGLRWSVDRKAYVRPGAASTTQTAAGGWRTSMGSQLSLGRRDPTQVRTDRFEEAVQRSLEARRFRVVQVSATHAARAVAALTASVPGLRVTSFDARFWTGLSAHVVKVGADPDFIIQVDRAGPDGPHWQIFVDRFVRPVTDEIVTGLLAQRDRPQLVHHAGLFARYGLAQSLDRLVSATEDEPGEGIWLLLPSWDDGGKPALRHPYGDLPIPIFKPAQRLRAPRAWIKTRGTP